jgi:DNA replication protein DnaC
MLNNATISKLRDMKLTSMAKMLAEQPENTVALTFEERLGLLVDAEWDARKTNRLKRLIRKAEYACPGASLEDVEYHSDRQLNKAQIASLGTCQYIRDRHNLVLLGATGCGKTYLACAFGMAANRLFLSTRYMRLPDLLIDLAAARISGTYSKVFTQYAKVSLLILDEWLLYTLKEDETRDVMELMEARHKRGSTIICSQFPVTSWHKRIGESILADAVCDRIVHDAYTLVIEGNDSMRKRKGIQPASSSQA